jgi:hypothetical protein
MVKPWSPDGGDGILGGGGNFRRWDLAGGSKSLGYVLGGLSLSLSLSFSLSFLADKR